MVAKLGSQGQREVLLRARLGDKAGVVPVLRCEQFVDPVFSPRVVTVMLQPRLRKCERGALEWQPLLLSLLRGLASLHAVNVAHLDVKPSNVMLTPNGDAVLTDLGVGLHVGADECRRGRGTPGYMAPEVELEPEVQCSEHDHDTFGVEADLYSLGVTLVELCGVRRTIDLHIAFDQLAPAGLGLASVVACLTNPCPLQRGSATDWIGLLEPAGDRGRLLSAVNVNVPPKTRSLSGKQLNTAWCGGAVDDENRASLKQKL